VEDLESKRLADQLLSRHGIVVTVPETGTSGPPVVRVTPNAFTAASEIDAFSEAVEEALRGGAPSDGRGYVG
jgi:7-keto-8-aminopelargonate synthetase-like enzyme